MNYIICDDDAIFAEDLAKKIKRLEPECEIRIFSTASSLVFNMDDIGLDIDAVFMDIKLGDGNGINVAVRLINKFPSLKIVYVTGYGSRYSQAIFECPQGFEPIAYLVKPIKEHYLKNALVKLKTAEKRYDNITIKSGGELIIINPKELIGISCRGRKLTLHTAENDYETNGRISTKIEQGEDFPIDKIDICSLMVNLVDNALRECENCEKPFVEIAVSRKINMLFVDVKNSCAALKSGKTRKLATTKSGDHGYGMEIINKIAEKYSGEFTFAAENGRASAMVMLKIK